MLKCLLLGNKAFRAFFIVQSSLISCDHSQFVTCLLLFHDNNRKLPWFLATKAQLRIKEVKHTLTWYSVVFLLLKSKVLKSDTHQVGWPYHPINTGSRIEITPFAYTVDSRYLKLGYLEFCETRSVYLNKKYILIPYSNHNLALDTFLQVQITRSAN